MNNSKYVIIEGKAIVFSSLIKHSDMVGYREVAQGAGLVRFKTEIDDDGYQEIVAEAYGRSESLGLNLVN
jgi:hypothetical protein